MRTSIRRLALTVIATTSACTQTETITDPGLQISAARPVSGPTYTAQEVGFLPGHVRSEAYGVNDLGYVVGESLPPAGADPWTPHAFIRAGGTMTELSEHARAIAVSSGSPVYVAGVDFTTGTPRRWTFDPVTRDVSEELIGTSGEGADINDAGLMIGTTAPGGEESRATLWPVGESPVTIAPTGGYTRSTGRGINNAGYAAVTFRGGGIPARGFLMIDDALIELTPATGHTMSFAGDVSEPVDGFVYVSGISAADTLDDYHLARWRVDVANGVVISVEARREVSEGRGASNEGVVPGQIEGKSSSSAIAWTLTGTISLKPTKGGSAAEAHDISANGRYIVGSAIYRVSSRGLLWTRSP